MITYAVDITVDRPTDDVFFYLADVTRHPGWMGGSRATPESDGPIQAGYRYRHDTDEGALELEVTDFQPGRRFAARTLSGPFSWTGSFEVVPDGSDRSRVLSSGSLTLSGIRRLAEPFVGGEVRRREQQELVKLKALAEGRPAEAGAG